MGIDFTRFEYISYQQWCVLHEGFEFRDVTNITGYAKWGSYLEDPLPGARLDLLAPLWISVESLSKAESGEIAKMSKETPPLLVFHVDHAGLSYITGGIEEKVAWEKVVLAFLSQHNRSDFD